MGIKQEKDTIIYKGTKYNFTFNLTTRQADGDIYRIKTLPNSIEKTLVMFFLAYPDADGIYEAIFKKTERIDSFYFDVWYNTLNPYIEDIKKNMKAIVNQNVNLTYAENWIDALKCIGLTDLEKSFYRCTGIENKQVLKKYAYQFDKYCNFIQTGYNFEKKIKALEKINSLEMPSSFMDFLLKNTQNYNEIKDATYESGMLDYGKKYDKYNFSDGKYLYIVPSTVQQVKEEANQQINCVYNSYLEQMVQGYHNAIIFVRKIETPEESYITLEYNPDGKELIQCKLKNNYNASMQEREYLLNQLNNR